MTDDGKAFAESDCTEHNHDELGRAGRSRNASKKMCLVATAPALLYMFNRLLIPELIQRGWNVTALTSRYQPGFGSDDRFAELQQMGLNMLAVPISRNPSVLRDLWCFLRLWWFFLWHRFDVIHASNPKAMLLATLAAFFAFHPRRVITVRGRVYENSQGFKRRVFVWLDRLTCRCADRVIVVSHSLREAMLKDGIGRRETGAGALIVIAAGSSQGCDAMFFDRDKVSPREIAEFKRTCHLGDKDRVILFAGRRRKDKGVCELVRAFEQLSNNQPDWHLILFGHEEKASDIGPSIRETIENHPKIHAFDWTSDLRTAYAAADIFVLPTWREGFPNTVLEASAMQVPVVTTTAVGAVDSVIDGETGFLVPVNDETQLVAKLETLIKSPELRADMGRNGRNRVVTEFAPERIRDGILDVYDSL